jgi:hypothetical protein
MTKPVRLFKIAVMLLLSGVFLNSCTEEMPVLTPLSGSGITSNKSIITVNIGNSTYSLKNQDPGYAIFASASTGSGTSTYTQYNITGSNGSQTNALDFILAYGLNTNNKYIVTTSLLDYNNKTYSTLNLTGAAKLTVDKMDANASTANGSFGYYLYDDIFTPTDSIYVSGTFNIVK